jgi:hypothetical protein
MAYKSAGIRRHKMSLSRYVREKIVVLRQLGIVVDEDQIKHMKSLKNEIQVDNYAHDLIMKR